MSLKLHAIEPPVKLLHQQRSFVRLEFPGHQQQEPPDTHSLLLQLYPKINKQILNSTFGTTLLSGSSSLLFWRHFSLII